VTNFLALSKIYKSFGSVQVLFDLNFKFDLEKSYAITGPSGSGKSTLMHILAGIDHPNSGTVNWSDQIIINQLSHAEKSWFWNQKLGLVFQQATLINELTVLQNVALKGLIGNLSDCNEQAYELLKFLKLEHRLDFFPNFLSRGEQQRVAIARAMMCCPQLILADEPVANLDQKNGENVIELLLDLSKKYRAGLIVSSHDGYVNAKMNQTVAIVDCKLALTS
jgi:ABC-type lipoprotein export system ATPase subunit